MENIQNYNVYNQRMATTMEEKLFFADRLDDSIDTIVDFGCADGTLLANIHEMKPNYRLVGIDIDENMRKLVKEKLEDVVLYASIEDFIENFNKENRNIAMVFSSVMHEVVAYTSNTYISFMNNIFSEVKPKQVIIRDMAINNYVVEMGRKGIVNHDIVDKFKMVIADKLTNENLGGCCSLLQQWDEFCSQYEDKNRFTVDRIIHFLLKYRYRENWKRECLEDYLPMPMEKILDYFLNIKGYNISFFEHKVLEYTRMCVMRDFGIDLKEYPTNYKIIITAQSK